jgi:glycosyltransferase involved in cell wall biosynthesis
MGTIKWMHHKTLGARYRLLRLLGLHERPELDRRRLRAFARAHRGSARALSVPQTLAVVVPCYGHERWLPAALASIAGQTRPPDVVVLVDDASPDNTAGVLEAFAREQAGRLDVRVERNPRNLGQCATLNRAVELAGTDAVMVCNDDDVLVPHAVATALALFRVHPGLGLLGAPCIPLQEGEEPDPAAVRDVGAPAVDVHPAGAALQCRSLNDLNMTHSGCTFLRLAWEAAGGYRPDASRRICRYSDRDFQLRVNALFPAGVADAPLAWWRSYSSVDSGRNT